MEALIFLLFLLTIGACKGDRSIGLRYYEDLYVKPLADGIVINHFTFTTQWDVSPEVLGHSANTGMFTFLCRFSLIPICRVMRDVIVEKSQNPLLAHQGLIMYKRLYFFL